MKTNIFKTIVEGAKEHAPTILTVMAVAGTIGAVASAIIMRPKYDKIIEEKKEEADKNNEEVGKKEIVKAAFKAYWPTLILIAASARCAIGANVINAKRVTAAFAAATTTKKLYDDYVEAAEKKLKPKQVAEVTDEMAKKRINNTFKDMKKGDKVAKQRHYSGPKDEDQWIYDCLLEKPFWGNPQDIYRNYVAWKDAYFTGSDKDVKLEWFYMETDIPFNKTPAIKHLGWSLGRHMPEGKWVPVAIEHGELEGEVVWGWQWTSSSMPEVIY